MEKLDPKTDATTTDIIGQNLDKLKELFPDVFTKGKVDFDALRETLGEYADDRQERYSFTWNGKTHARRIAQTPSTATLRPCPEESVNWDTTQNLFIEGDNLEVLKLLQKSYHRKVKVIYIDPPYNTGGDFIYPDDFRDNIKNYMELTGQTDEEGRKLSANAETGGRYHTNWLNMMYPRLKLARNLLRDDGVIFVSIGSEELHDLLFVMNEVFGEECQKNIIVIRRGVKNVQAQFETVDSLNRGHEYVLFYSRSSDYRFEKIYIPDSSDDEPVGSWNNHWRGTDRPTMRYELFGITPESGQWRWSENRSNAALENWKKLTQKIGASPDIESIDKWVAEAEVVSGQKIDLLRLSSNDKPEHYIHPSDGKLASDLWVDLKPNGNSQLRRLFSTKVFETPKSVDLLMRLVDLGLQDGTGTVLDFFAGSCATAHSILEMNVGNNGGNRKFIMVQLPETCDEQSEAFKAGYKNIADIGKERIRRIIKKLEAEQTEKAKETKGKLPGISEDLPEPDLGFKVFKLDASNIKPWDADFDNLETALLDSVENIKPDRTESDVLYELLLKYGLDLAVPIDERQIGGKTVYIIGAGALIVCLAEEISLDVVEGIAALKKEMKPEVMRVVFKDAGFADDVVKTNAVQILRQAGIEDVKSL